VNCGALILWSARSCDVALPLFYSRSHPAVIRGYDAAGNVIETHEHVGGVQKVVKFHSYHTALSR
jgi:hypothetical protein